MPNHHRRLRPARRPRLKPCLVLEKLEARHPLAMDFSLVRDLNPVNSYDTGSNYLAMGDKLYFGHSNSASIGGLWVTDGTQAGTHLVSKRVTGDARNLTNVSGTLYFRANGGLWKSDGTEAGTVLITGAYPAENDAANRTYLNVNGTLFFRGTTPATGIELFKTDPSTSVATLVRDIAPGFTSSGEARGSDPGQLTNVNGTLFFVANDPVLRGELFKSDGTAGGTVLVKDITPVADSFVNHLTNFNGTLYFTAYTPADGSELWKSDGTDSGTVMVKDIFLGAGKSSSPRELSVAGNKLYFRADDSLGTALWVSDGTDAGTVPMRHVNPRSYPGIPTGMTNVNGTIYFLGAENRIISLWKSDGTVAGTVPLKSGEFDSLLNVAGTLYLKAGYNKPQEIWKSDGTVSGTVRVTETTGTQAINASGPMAAFKGQLAFGGLSQDAGGVWLTDGSADGTRLASRLALNLGDSFPTGMAPVGASMFFMTGDSNFDTALWRTDGSTQGTIKLKDFLPLNRQSPNTIVDLNGQAIFVGRDAEHGAELWTSDGTVAGTTMLKDFMPGLSGSMSAPIWRLGNKALFVATTTEYGSEFWTSDGTLAGTSLVKDLEPGSSSINISTPVLVGNQLFFNHWRGSTFELWRTDGTDAGTVLLKSGLRTLSNANLYNANGTLYFFAMEGNEAGLWRSDGTPTGTRQVKSLSVPTGFYTDWMANVGGQLYFLVDRGLSTETLWVSDGSAAGTNPVRQVTGVTNMFAYQGKLYFQATAPGLGSELWVSDGTSFGTGLLKDLVAGPDSSLPSRFFEYQGSMYFVTTSYRMETLWKSDGTSSGTQPVALPANSPTRVYKFGNEVRQLGSQLLLTAASDLNGLELFTLALTDYGDAPTGSLVENLGAMHIASGPLLGALRDTTEVDGQPGPGSDGDDLNGIDDEDGLLTSLTLQAGETSNVEIMVTGAETNSRLFGWFDWNFDGDWDDANEFMIAGVPATNGVNRFAITVPTGIRNGLGAARFRLANQSELGPLGLATSGEIEDHALQLGDSAVVNLPLLGSNDITIRKSGANVQVVDINGQTLFSQPLARLYSLRIVGADTQTDKVTIDYLTGGFFDLVGGINLNGQGGSDRLNILGNSITSVTQGSIDSATKPSQLMNGDGTSQGWVRFVNFEDLSFANLKAFEITGNFDVGGRTISIGSQTPVKLGTSTLLSGGVLISDGFQLSVGDVLSGHGRVEGNIQADAGSVIRLDGELTLGLATSTIGFASSGSIDTDAHRLILLDSNAAEILGSLRLGSLTADGAVQANQGLNLSSRTIVSGRGTLQSTNDASTPITNSGSIRGVSVSQSIIVTGYLTGLGLLDGVRITGTYDPGPGIVNLTHGSVVYSGRVILQATGDAPGTQFDRLNHTGTATLGGVLEVQRPLSFVPSTILTMLTAVGGVIGRFSSIIIPPVSDSLAFRTIYGAQSFSIELVGLVLTSSSAFVDENGGRAFMTLTRSGHDFSQPLTIALVNGDRSELSIPASITIAAGEVQATFDVLGVDDTLLDGPQLVSVSAVADEYNLPTISITVRDIEDLTLTFDVPQISEAQGRTQATVTRGNTDLGLPLTVNLLSSDTSEAVVPASVIIPAGSASATFEILGVDDRTLDGPQTIEIRASADGYQAAARLLDVLDSEQFLISVASSSIRENNGSTQVTITRDTDDNSFPLLVDLVSLDESELLVPATVAFPAGENTTTFTVFGVDDSELDGTQQATFEVSAPGFERARGTIAVEDYEPLVLTLFRSSMPEQGGTINGLITRDTGDLSGPLTISLFSSDTSEASVPTTVTIPAGENLIAFTVTSQDDTLLDGDQEVNITAVAAGFVSGTAKVRITDVETMSLEFLPPIVAENVGTTNIKITRNNTNIDQPLVVNLVSNRTDTLQVPATVTIPAGESALTFAATVVDNNLLEGGRSAVVVASATGYVSTNATLQLTDHESLVITLPVTSVRENAGSIQATVRRNNTNISAPITVALSTDDFTEALVPSTVVILANQSSATFVVVVRDDDLLDGTQSVHLKAVLSGYVTGDATLDVLDYEPLALSIDRTSISEKGGTATGTVSRNGTISDGAVIVSISVGGSHDVRMPTTVTIPADQQSVNFTIEAQDNALLDGTRNLTVEVSASGFESASKSLSISDSESLTVSFAQPSVFENAGTVTATVSRSNTDIDQPLVVSLLSLDTQRATVPTSVTILAGQRQVDFPITIVNDRVFAADRVVDITAKAAGYEDAKSSLTIKEDDREFPWQNARNRLDVNDDRFVTALDALLIINAINVRFQLTPQLPDPFFPVEYLDVSGDNVLSAIDALLVINALNNPGQAEGEDSFDQAVDLMAEDIRKLRQPQQTQYPRL